MLCCDLVVYCLMLCNMCVLLCYVVLCVVCVLCCSGMLCVVVVLLCCCGWFVLFGLVWCVVISFDLN